MTRKILFWSSLLLAISIIAYTIFVLYKGKQAWQNVYSVVPADAFAVVEFMAPQTNLAASSICNHWNDLAEQYLGELNAHFPKQNGSHTMVFATLQIKPDSGWIAAVGLPLYQSESGLEKLVRSLGFGPGRQLIGWNIMDSKDGMFAVVFKNCLLVSPKINALETVLRKNTEEDFLLSNRTFQKALKTASSDEDVHFFFADGGGGWLGLDYPSKSPDSSWFGYEVFADSSLSLVNALSAGDVFLDPASFGQKCILIDQYTTRDIASDWQARNAIDEGKQSSALRKAVWQQTSDSCGCNLDDAYLAWQKGISGTAVFEADSGNKGVVGFIAIEDSVDIDEWIAPLIRPNDDGVSEIRYPDVFAIGNVSENPITPKYVGWNKQILFYSSSYELVKSLIAQPISWVDAKGCGRWSWTNTQTLTGLSYAIAQLVHPAMPLSIFYRPASENKVLVEVRMKGQMTNNAQAITETVETPIQSDISVSPIIGKSWQVKNHLTGEIETISQDAENYLILQGADGKTLWRTQAGEGIIGDIEQIDAFQNGKLQYLFCTAHFVNLIDRKGKQVEGFPVKFAEEIKNGPAVIDYDQKKNYRILVSHTAGIANLLVNGQPAAGWKYKGEPTMCSAAGIRAQGQDYIVMVSCNGELSLLRRNGERIETKWSKLDGYDGGRISLNVQKNGRNFELCWPSSSGVAITQELMIPR